MAVEDRLRARCDGICVFSGSSPGAHPDYARGGRGARRARSPAQGLGLVYGGASVGLMGAVADAALAAGGEVVGVIPQALVDREIAHPGLTELHVVGSMHERKALMAELADGFVALPGGMGTLEELFEVYTWTQLGLHAKPLGLLDVRGYYAQLVALPRPRGRGALRHAPSTARCSWSSSGPEALLERVQALARAGAREVDRSRADLSSASIAAAAADGASGSATCSVRAGARLEPAQLDDVARRGAASSGISATPTPATTSRPTAP